MEIQCPSCKKINISSSECIRCGCQLEILMAIIKAAQYELCLSSEKLRNGSPSLAKKHAERSWYLKKSINAAKLAFFASIREKKFSEAMVWRQKAKLFDA